MKGRQGFTLMELLVVLLIIGILSTVALRTIDATRDRSLFDQTTKEMNQLVQAITGNPDMTYDGRRVDFGFFGDMGKLPDDLRELVHNPGDTNWHGPYVRRTFGGDTASYLLDGWGHFYIYRPLTGEIASEGNGKYPMTVRVADELAQLYNNTISGTITDGENNPPGDKTGIMVDGYLSSGKQLKFKIPDPGGYYRFSLAPPDFDTVPIGTHRLVARMGGDSLVRWVTVAPRSKTIVDFRFSKSFRSQLQMVDQEIMLDSSGFQIQLFNNGETEVPVEWIFLKSVSDSAGAHMRELWIEQALRDTFSPRLSQGDTATLTTAFSVPPNTSAWFGFQKFYTDPDTATTLSKINGDTFLFRFSDGSEIEVIP